MSGIELGLEYTVRRSGRRTIAICVQEDGALLVRSPQRVSQATIEELLHEKRHWIERKQGEVRQRMATVRPKSYVDGELFWYLGREYPLSLSEDPAMLCAFDGSCFRLHRRQAVVGQRLLTQWYQREAGRVLGERCQYYAELGNFDCAQVSLSRAKKRWGSCNYQKKSLNFNWRLVMAPLRVLDYVVVHELCHLQHPDHSRLFWQRVEAMMPDYREQEQWLKENGLRLIC